MKKTLLILLAIIIFQYCKAQQAQTTLPKIENYIKGELEIKAGGSIHFDWCSDISSIENTGFYMSSHKHAKVSRKT